MTVYGYIKTETDKSRLYQGIREILEDMDKRGKYPEDWEIKKIQRLADEKYAQIELAERFCKAIKALTENEYAIENMESYLAIHFPIWMEKWAHDPEGLTSELEHFSKITLPTI